MSYNIIDYIIDNDLAGLSGKDFLDALVQANTEVLSRTKKREVVDRKGFLIYCYNEFTGLSKTKIGKLFGSDHCMVIHHVKRHQDLINDRVYRENIKDLFNKVEQFKEQLK